MSEIKFRGRRVDDRGWVYGDVSNNPLINKSYIFSYNTVRSYVYEIVPETVGQFIGLKDRNGIEIYEGDIAIKFGLPVELEIDNLSFRSEVVFQKGAFGYVHEDMGFISFVENYHFRWENCMSNRIEVVGNIHEVTIY